MASFGIELGISCGSDLATVYANLVADAAGTVSISSNGHKTLVLMAGQIQSAAFQQGAAQGESTQQIQTNARQLANIGAFCQKNQIDITVDAILTPPNAQGFFLNAGTTAVNGYVNAWGTAAAAAALPITKILDIQEVGTEAASNLYGVTTAKLAAIAGSEALAVNTLLDIYRQFANDATSGSVEQLSRDAGLPQGQPFVTAAGHTLSDQRVLIANSYTNAVANLTVGDMEAGSGSFTNTVLEDVAQFWNDYDRIANSGTVDLYSSWTNIDGRLTQSPMGLNAEDPSIEIPNAETIWSQGTILNANAFDQIINPGVITNLGSMSIWTAALGTLPAGWTSPAGTASTPLYEILQSGSVYTYVYRQAAVLTLNAAQKHLSFVTSDTGSGAPWQQWLQGLETLASGGTIYNGSVAISIGSNPTLSLNVITEPLGVAISPTQTVQQAEHQAAMLASFGVAIDNFVNEVWTNSPLGVGPIYAPDSWANAGAEISATSPFYAAHLITATGSSGVAVTTPGQRVVSIGTTTSLGNLSLIYNAIDAKQARLGIVILDLNGHLSLTSGTLARGSSSEGTFGSSGIFSGAGSNMLVLNGNTADLAQALSTIAILEDSSGPDTVDIETYGINGQLSDSQINLYALLDDTADVNARNSLDWAMSSATISQGTLTSEILNWRTIAEPSSVLVTGVPSPSLFKTDMVFATLSNYDVFASGDGLLTNGTSLTASPYDSNNNLVQMPYNGGLNLLSQTTSLIVQRTTNLFDRGGSLVQSIDTLVAPLNVDGVDGSNLVQWGTQVTYYKVDGSSTPWNFGTQYTSAQLTFNNQGQTIQALFQGGSSGSISTLYQIFNPNHPAELWQEIRTTTALNGSGWSTANLQAIVTEYNTGDNPFWDSQNWGTVMGAITNEIWSNGGNVYGGAGATLGVDGSSEVINLPNGGTVYGSPNASNVVNGNGLRVWMSADDTLTVTGNNVIVTGGARSTVRLAGDGDTAGLHPASTVMVSGRSAVIHGDMLNVFTSSSTASVSIYGNSNHITATPGSSITIVGASGTVALPSAAITLNTSASTTFRIEDTATGFAAHLGELAGWNTKGLITGISLTDPGVAVITLTPSQMALAANIISLITTPFTLWAGSVTAASAATVATMPNVKMVSVSDTAADVVANLAALQSLAANGFISSITLTDTGTPTLIPSASQVVSCATAISLIKSPYLLSPSLGDSSHYTVIDSNGTGLMINLLDGSETPIQGRRISFSDGIGLFDPTGTAGNVARVYGALLYRAPDVSGLEYWTATIDDSNVPLSQVAEAFAKSPEFIADYNVLSDASFVSQLYDNALGRPPDAGGAQAWENVLASGVSRGSVALSFAESAENIANTVSTAGDNNTAEVYRLYRAALNRIPDAGGMSYWSSQRANGATEMQLAQCFIGSREFQSNYGALSIADFVTTMYNNVLHRAPDAGGYQFWVSGLQNGLSEASVLINFSDSSENRILTAGATHANWVFIPN
jgi:hypothetical protein